MSTNSSISVCDIFKNNISKVIKKLKIQIPSHFQIYSDTYKEYLHVIDDIFETYILSEKEFFDKMKIDKNLMKNIETYTNYFTGIRINQIENYDNYLKWYAQMRISGMKSYDQFVHIMMNSYSKIFANFMINFEK